MTRLSSRPGLLQCIWLIAKTWAHFRPGRLIPRRRHHARLGAHGTFTVTTISAAITKAKISLKIDSRRPMFARFFRPSPATRAPPMRTRHTPAWPPIFYTEEGNLDNRRNNTPCSFFAIRCGLGNNPHQCINATPRTRCAARTQLGFLVAAAVGCLARSPMSCPNRGIPKSFPPMHLFAP